VQVEFFLKINKHADQNKAMQGGFFFQNNKCACTSIRYARVSCHDLQENPFPKIELNKLTVIEHNFEHKFKQISVPVRTIKK
jgi:hypothetical protein